MARSSTPHLGLFQSSEMGSVGLKTCCLYLCLIFLSGVILLTSFTIQWILYSIQFSLVSAEYWDLVISFSCSYRKVLEW